MSMCDFIAKRYFTCRARPPGIMLPIVKHCVSIRFCCITAVVCGGVFNSALGEEGDPRAAAIVAADDARIAAMTAADPAALAPILSADLLYSHSNGAVDTKDSLLELIGGKATRYVSYRPVKRAIRFATSEIALEHGRAEIVLEKDGKQSEATFLFLAVWRLEDGVWRFLQWQSARPPAPTPAP